MTTGGIVGNRRFLYGYMEVRTKAGALADAIIVPEQALTERNDRTGVFVVSEDETALQPG